MKRRTFIATLAGFAASVGLLRSTGAEPHSELPPAPPRPKPRPDPFHVSHATDRTGSVKTPTCASEAGHVVHELRDFLGRLVHVSGMFDGDPFIRTETVRVHCDYCGSPTWVVFRDGEPSSPRYGCRSCGADLSV